MILERASPNLNSPEDLYREFHTNMSQFREPPPYPGLTKQPNQPGLRQSFSGSETSTDVSVSSTENLATCQRQEPQGEETQTQQSCFPYDISTSTPSDYSILARLGMPTSGMDLKSQNTPHIYVSGNTPSHGPHFATSPSHGQGYYMSSESGFSSASNSSSKLTMQDFQNLSPNVSKSSSTFSSPTSVSSYSSSTLYANYPFTQMSGVDPNLLQFVQSGQMVPQYLSSLPPPPEYPGLHKQDLLERPEQRRSYEVLGKPDIPGVRSQPDLSTFWESRGSVTGLHHSHGGSSGSKEGSQQSLEQSCYSTESRIQEYDNIALQATRMVEVLTEENKGLREKLAIYDKKVSKLQKFELEIQKVHEAYEALVKSSKKREYLEQVMKKRLEEELKMVQQQNECYVRQLEDVGVKPVGTNKRASRIEPVDGSMETLLAKHKELLTVKERQDIELANARSTILDQKQQIDILRTVQSNVRLEEECQRQQILSEYDQQIQEELASLKEAYEKKEQTEKSIRQKLDKELEYCRSHHKQGTLGKKSDTKKDLNSDIKRMLDEKEAKILQLEKEVIQWKEQHLEESIRKLKLQELECETRLPTYEQALPVSTESLRLPTYEQCPSPVNTETLINEAKEEKLKNMEEVYQANCKLTELEAQVKSLTSQLSEKEAMLRVYQRSPMTRSSSVHTIYCTPHHSPRPSLIATGSLSRQGSQDTSLFIKHKKTASSSALETSSKLSQDDLFQKIQSLQAESKSSSDTEDGSDKTIWQV